jgi:ATP/maltotriose-dependent transcriptional regulator MalT
LSEVWRLAAAGFQIEDVAPPRDCVLWEAVADARCFRGGRAGILVPIVYRTTARDNARGLAAGVYSQLTLPNGRTLGEVVTRAFQTTQIAGAAKRVRRARERLSDVEARAAVASALTSHLRGEGAWTDGGVPPAEFEVAEIDLSTGDARILARGGAWGPAGLAGSKRRSDLFDAVLIEFENEAFGSRGDAERTFDGTFVPLDEHVTHGASGDFSEDVEARLDLADLVARAGLTPREHEVFSLCEIDDLSAETVADLLKPRLAASTVRVHLHNAREKLKRAATQA